MPEKMVIFTALAYEAKAIAPLIAKNPAVELCVIGPGAGRLPTSEQVCDCRGILMAGLGGALDPELQIGEVIVDSQGTAPAGQWRRGEFHTADKIIATPDQKLELFRTTGALVVDMENAHARALAKTIGVPFLGIRAISDRADDVLDPAVIRMVDSSGHVRAGRLAGELLRNPARVASMLRLKRRSNIAMRNLSAALTQILRAAPACSSPLTTSAQSFAAHRPIE